VAGSKFVYQWRQELEAAAELIASDRLVALTVMGHMGADGRDAYPSIKTIVGKTRMAKSTVLCSMGWLRASGWLLAQPRSRRQSNVYSAVIPVERKTRTDRSRWASERAARLASQRASRSQTEPAEQVADVTDSGMEASGSQLSTRVGRNGGASGSQSLRGVGRNGEPGTTPDLSKNNPANTPLTRGGVADTSSLDEVAEDDPAWLEWLDELDQTDDEYASNGEHELSDRRAA
jgi:hypothetical protein